MLAKLIHFLEHPEDLDKYWEGHGGLKTMEQHWNELLPYYGLPNNPEPVKISMKDYSFLLMENEFLKQHVIIDGNTSSADLESLRRELNEAREEIERGKRNERIVNRLNKLLPEGSLRRKIAKKLFGGK